METIVKNCGKSKFIEKQDNMMTATQIRKKVGEAWAFLENPVYEKGILVSANLLYYNTDKVKVLEELAKHKKGHFAMLYFGTIDTEQVYIL